MSRRDRIFTGVVLFFAMMGVIWTVGLIASLILKLCGVG